MTESQQQVPTLKKKGPDYYNGLKEQYEKFIFGSERLSLP